MQDNPDEAYSVTIPLLNPNEPEAQVSAVHVRVGQHVAPGEPLCTLETTKSTADLEAEREGFVVDIRFHEGQSARAGELFCYLASSPDWQPAGIVTDSLSPTLAAPSISEDLPPGLRMTQPALALARQHRLDLSQFPTGSLVTEALVREHIERLAQPAFAPPISEFDPAAILIYGGGGHAKALIDLLRLLGTYRIVGIIDDGLDLGETPFVMGVPVLGGAQELPVQHQQGVRLAVNAVGGIGSIATRIQVFHRLAQAGFACPPVVHPTALVEPSAQLAPGVQVFPHAYVGSEAHLGYGVIVNTGAIVSHECTVADYANLSPGSILAGQVQVGAGALVGMGVTVNLRVVIGANARIGNSAVVKADIPEGGVVRAGAAWPPDKA